MVPRVAAGWQGVPSRDLADPDLHRLRSMGGRTASGHELANPSRLDAHERVPRVGVVRVLARSAVRDVVAPDAVIGGHAEVPTLAALYDVPPRVAPDRVAAGAALAVGGGASPPGG